MTKKVGSKRANAKGGRPPSKPTAREIAEILEGLELGMAITLAARKAGVHHSKVFRWLARARRPDAAKVYRDFARAVYQAETVPAESMLRVIREASADRWQAAAWLLERRYGYKTGARPDLEVDAGIAAAEAAEGDGELGDLRKHLAEVEQLRKQAVASGSFVAASSVLNREGEIRQRIAAETSRLREEAQSKGSAGDMVSDIVADLRDLPEHIQRAIIEGIGPAADA